jgi:16S rRNA (guanine966-N2)-methyltransferase
MRIIAGMYKGRKIAMPKGIRPTRDNVKEAVFNVLHNRIVDTRVLDLFAGSGALGAEALSRSAKEVVFVDSFKECTDTIYDNITKLSIESMPVSVRIITKDACVGIKLLSTEGKKFDVIFLDPPYCKDKGHKPYTRNRIRKCLKYISVYDILCHSGLVFVEHFKKDIMPQNVENLILSRQLYYGDTVITIYKKREKND